MSILLKTIFFLVFFSSLINCISLNDEKSQKSIIAPLIPSENYIKYVQVDEDQPNVFVVYWRIQNDTIIFELHCKNTGWVGIGFSPSGGMRGADIAIGWVDSNGKGHMKVIGLIYYY